MAEPWPVMALQFVPESGFRLVLHVEPCFQGRNGGQHLTLAHMEECADASGHGSTLSVQMPHEWLDEHEAPKERAKEHCAVALSLPRNEAFQLIASPCIEAPSRTTSNFSKSTKSQIAAHIGPPQVCGLRRTRNVP